MTSRGLWCHALQEALMPCHPIGIDAMPSKSHWWQWHNNVINDHDIKKPFMARTPCNQWWPWHPGTTASHGTSEPLMAMAPCSQPEDMLVALPAPGLGSLQWWGRKVSGLWTGAGHSHWSSLGVLVGGQRGESHDYSRLAWRPQAWCTHYTTQRGWVERKLEIVLLVSLDGCQHILNSSRGGWQKLTTMLVLSRIFWL